MKELRIPWANDPQYSEPPVVIYYEEIKPLRDMKPVTSHMSTKVKELVLSEVKKVLYREKPIAYIAKFGTEFYKYSAETSLGIVYFHVPMNEMGDLPFGETEQAQLLIRWIKL